MEELKPIQHLMEALHHLSQVDDTQLEQHRIQLRIKAIYEAKTEGLEGRALIDRLDDDELVAAIRAKDGRLGLYSGPHLEPTKFQYIRRQRLKAAATAFSSR
jgi:hypothetical protein